MGHVFSTLECPQCEHYLWAFRRFIKTKTTITFCKVESKPIHKMMRYINGRIQRLTAVTDVCRL